MENIALPLLLVLATLGGTIVLGILLGIFIGFVEKTANWIIGK